MGRLCNTGNAVLTLNRWVVQGRLVRVLMTDQDTSRWFAIGFHLLSPLELLEHDRVRVGLRRASRGNGQFLVEGKEHNHGRVKNGQHERNGHLI
jgi:hypothetical protein